METSKILDIAFDRSVPKQKKKRTFSFQISGEPQELNQDQQKRYLEGVPEAQAQPQVQLCL